VTLICDKNAQMNVFFVSFSAQIVNILDEIANAKLCLLRRQARLTATVFSYYKRSMP
jgi:hypothetical protein